MFRYEYPRPVPHRLGQNGIDQADNGRIVFRLHQVTGLRDFVRESLKSTSAPISSAICTAALLSR